METEIGRWMIKRYKPAPNAVAFIPRNNRIIPPLLMISFIVEFIGFKISLNVVIDWLLPCAWMFVCFHHQKFCFKTVLH